MEKAKVTAVIFEGGQCRTTIDEEIVRVRTGIVLDTIKKLKDAADVDAVILATNRQDLKERAAYLGACVDFSAESEFHFGKRLRKIILAHKIERIICMGGAAAPLLTSDEFQKIAFCLKKEKNIVITNNVQSADLVAFTPARAIDEIELPQNDNTLGNLLRGIGLKRALLPNLGRVNFDIDTPMDILILGMHPMCGPMAKKAIDSLGWDTKDVKAALSVLRNPPKEVLLAGRVGPWVVQYINANLYHRVRVFSEERGMKALGRDTDGRAVSLLGFMLSETGSRKFFQYLEKVADVCFLDTRVIMAHLKLNLSDWDRFQGDLGRWELVRDPILRQFVKDSLDTDIPILLGGHSLVSGGIWLLAEMAILENEPNHTTFDITVGP